LKKILIFKDETGSEALFLSSPNGHAPPAKFCFTTKGRNHFVHPPKAIKRPKKKESFWALQ